MSRVTFPALVCAVLAAKAAPIWAGNCSLDIVCAGAGACAQSRLQLSRSAQTPGQIEIGGDVHAVRYVPRDRITSTVRLGETPWWSIQPGPAFVITEPGFSGALVSDEDTGMVHLTLMPVPRERIRDQDALSSRTVARGMCEALF